MPAVEMNMDQFAQLVTQAAQRDMLGKFTDTYSMSHLADLAESISSAQYFVEKMQKAKRFDEKIAQISYAVSTVRIDGLLLEFGVSTGTTINHLSTLVPQKQLYGFDVFFTGLPEEWRPGFEAGKFARTELPKVNNNVELIVGLFEDSLPGFVDKHPGPIAYLHVDCDLYSSTKTIFRNLGHKIVKGTVIVFDEYINYPGWKEHEYKAFQEYIAWSGQTYEYISVVDKHQQAAVVITS